MARPPRSLSVVPSFSVHKVWRGHNKEANIRTREQKQKYMDLMNEDLESEKYQAGSTLEAATLMDNHTHELNGIRDQVLFSNHMRRHHSRYGAYFNRENNRCGKVAQDRPHTTLVADDTYAMEVVFYIHANPIRANIVKDARDYYWSTHKLYAFGIREPWMRNVVLPRWYLGMGKTDELRQRRYRQLFANYLRTYGPVKRVFLKRLFFGPATWMQERQELLKQWIQASRKYDETDPCRPPP